MREVRPYFLHTRRHNVVDGRLKLEIRKQLSMLQQRMRTTGQAFGAWKRVLSDGTTIVTSASYNGPVPVLRAYVSVPGRSEEVIEVPCEILSGLFHVNPIQPIPPETGEAARFYFRRFENGIDTFGPEWESSSKLNGSFESSFGFDVDCGSYLLFKERMTVNRGTQHSGTMRFVVQALQGMGAAIPFNFQWCETHGIFKNKKKTAPGEAEYWVIEISAERGVVAWTLPTCEVLSAERKAEYHQKLEILPGKSAGSLLGEGRAKRTLLDAGLLSSFYSGATAFYPEMGWAFSYDGHEASNIRITWPDTYKRASLWKLTIEADPVTGEPASAILEEEEEKYLYQGAVSAPKFPYYTPLYTSLVSYDTFYGVYETPSGDRDYPVDVLYLDDEQNTRVIVRAGTAGTTGSVTNPADFPPAGYSLTCGNYLVANINVNGVFHSTSWTSTNVASPHYTVSGVNSPIPADQQFSTGNISLLFHFWEKKQYGCFCEILASNTVAFSEYWENPVRIANSIKENYNRAATYVKPFFDREVFILYHKKKHATTGGLWNLSRMGGGYGHYWNNIRFGYGDHARAFPIDGTCGSVYSEGDYSNGSLAPRVLSAAWAPEPQTAYEENESCDSGQLQYLKFNFAYPSPLPIRWCQGFIQISSPGDQEISSEENVYVFNPVLKDFLNVHTGEYTAFDPFTPASSDPTQAAQLFFVYFDVFTGEGMCSSYINQINPEDLYFHGEINTAYPTDQDWPGFSSGWFGVPKRS